MVKEIKSGVSKVKQVSEVVYSILCTVALSAAVIKLATQPYIETGLGLLPVWQVVAAALLTLLAFKLWKLHCNER